MPPYPNDILELFQHARQAARSAYAPYSQFQVGCAIRTKTGKTILGCNVENASFGVTICAERNAACRAVLEQELDWKSIAIVSPTGVSPCGACRQFLAEFAPELEVWFGHLDPNMPIAGPIALSTLLPAAMEFRANRTSANKPADS